MSGEYVRYRCVLLGRSPISQTWHCVYQPLTGHTYPRKGWGSSRKKVRVCAMRWGILLGFIWKEQGRFFQFFIHEQKEWPMFFFSSSKEWGIFFIIQRYGVSCLSSKEWGIFFSSQYKYGIFYSFSSKQQGIFFSFSSKEPDQGSDPQNAYPGLSRKPSTPPPHPDIYPDIGLCTTQAGREGDL